MLTKIVDCAQTEDYNITYREFLSEVGITVPDSLTCEMSIRKFKRLIYPIAN